MFLLTLSLIVSRNWLLEMRRKNYTKDIPKLHIILLTSMYKYSTTTSNWPEVPHCPGIYNCVLDGMYLFKNYFLKLFHTSILHYAYYVVYYFIVYEDALDFQPHHIKHLDTFCSKLIHFLIFSLLL